MGGAWQPVVEDVEELHKLVEKTDGEVLVVGEC